MEWIDAAEVHRRCDWSPLVEHLRLRHREPPAHVDRTLMTVGSDSFLLLPAWQPHDQLGIKVVTIMPENLNDDDAPPSVQGIYLLFDGNDGAPLAAIDGTALTYRKTAADSALGALILAPAEPRTLLVVGAGALAPYLAEAHQAVHPSIERVIVWNRSRERADALAQRIGADATSDLAGAARAADVITTATASTTPLLTGSMVSPGTHVDLVGSFTPDMRESDSELMAKALVFGDTRWNTADTGDIEQAVADGVIDGIAADLFDLCSGAHPGRTSSGAITVFKNGGGGHLDLMTAAFIGHQR